MGKSEFFKEWSEQGAGQYVGKNCPIDKILIKLIGKFFRTRKFVPSMAYQDEFVGPQSMRNGCKLLIRLTVQSIVLVIVWR